MSQEGLGTYLGVSRQAIHNWESGKSVAHPELVSKALRHYDFDQRLLIIRQLAVQLRSLADELDGGLGQL